ncbi:MAG: ammonium transporter [Myxococcales bacterium]|nr:ammonium transporter [Myxococcales bacterium]
MRPDTGDTAWLLCSTALVLLMTPALALFYGGLVRRKNVLSTIMHSMAAIPVVSVVWLVIGYSLAFGPSVHGIIGGLDFAFLNGLVGEQRGTVPTLAFVAFQAMFAVITPALISGGFAERMKFVAYLAFIVGWSLLVYAPVAHWVWAEGGWLFSMGALDFAGGTVIHVTAGVSALVCALVVGKRLKYPVERPLPHNLTMTMLGAGLLWFGWFGFNAGSALASGHLAAVAFLNTHMGAAGGALGWVIVEWRHGGKPTALGVASGLVAGLVAITPAAGFVAPWAALVIGIVSGAACFGAVLVKYRLGYDDTLDAFGVHGVGGVVGALLTGVFAEAHTYSDATAPVGADGLIKGGFKQLGVQAVTTVVAAAYAGLATWVLLRAIDRFIGVRVAEGDEREGLDTSLHGEEGYAG